MIETGEGRRGTKWFEEWGGGTQVHKCMGSNVREVTHFECSFGLESVHPRMSSS